MKELRLIITVLLISSCSPQFHYKRIVKKDPSFFKVDTTIIRKVTINEIKPYTVRFKPLPIDTLEFIDVRDSVRIRVLTFHDTIQVTADCPDSKIIEIEKKVPEPYPVYVKPSFWQKVKSGSIIAGVILLVLVLFFIVFKVVRG